MWRGCPAAAPPLGKSHRCSAAGDSPLRSAPDGPRPRPTSVLEAAHYVALQQPRGAGDAVDIGHLVEEIHHELGRLLAGQDVGRQFLNVEDLPQPLQGGRQDVVPREGGQGQAAGRRQAQQPGQAQPQPAGRHGRRRGLGRAASVPRAASRLWPQRAEGAAGRPAECAARWAGCSALMAVSSGEGGRTSPGPLRALKGSMGHRGSLVNIGGPPAGARESGCGCRGKPGVCLQGTPLWWQSRSPRLFVFKSGFDVRIADPRGCFLTLPQQ